MAVMCPVCGGLSRDPEACDHCRARLAPLAAFAPPACPLSPTDPTPLTEEQREALDRPEASVTVSAGGRDWRLHWVPAGQWPLWRPRVDRRLALRLGCLPPARVIPDHGGVWVAVEASPLRPAPWQEADRLAPLDRLRRLVDFLGALRRALEELHAAGLVWLTFHPSQLEEADGGLRFTNLDLAVYPAGTCPADLGADPAFAAPEVCRFHDADVGPRADVFHLALFAYYWLARYLPEGFLGGGLESFDFALPPLRVYAPGLPPGVAPVLARGLAADPSERFASVAELDAELRSALGRAERRWRGTGPVAWDVGHHTRAGSAKTALGRPNQDAVLVRRFAGPERALAVVADGISYCDVGSGEIASRMTCDVLDQALGPDCRQEDFPRRVTEACRRANGALLDWALAQGAEIRLLAGHHLMGTTVLAGWLEGAALTLANAGDSRAYLIDEAGVEQLTVDGDIGCSLLAAGASPREVARFGANSKALRECVGGCYRTPRGKLAVDEDLCRPALSWWPLLPGDVIVLCSDGLVEEEVFLDPADLAALVRRHHDLPAAELAAKLAAAADALQRPLSELEPEGFGDNISCVVIKVGPAMAPAG